MGHHPEPSPARVTVNVEMTIDGNRVQVAIPVPAAPTPASQMLPVLQGLAEDFVQLGVQDIEDQGQTISCRKGCGACCRQLVPISGTEARRIRDVVDGLPEPRRSIVRDRFSEIRERLDQTGLLDKLEHPEQARGDTLRSLGLEYFHMGMACPFLEEESCSIYADRPIACREYLVTSPALHCSNPTAETIDRVPVPAKVSSALFRIEDPRSPAVHWVALSLAPGWADEHPDDLPPRTGPEWLREVFGWLSGKNGPLPDVPTAPAG